MSLLDDLLPKKSPAADLEGPQEVRTQSGVLRLGFPVKVTGGKYNGLVGQIVKLGLDPCHCSAVYFNLEESKTTFEGVVEHRFLEDFAQWKARRSATELTLKGV